MRTAPDWMQWDRAGKVVARRWYADYAKATGATVVEPDPERGLTGLMGDRIIVDDPVWESTPEQIEAARRLFLDTTIAAPANVRVSPPLRLSPTLFEGMGEAQRLPPVKPPRPRRGE